MSESITLSEALNVLVDSIMETYGIDTKKYPELRTVLMQVSAATASLMAKHFARILPAAEPKETGPVVAGPWKKGGSHVH